MNTRFVSCFFRFLFLAGVFGVSTANAEFVDNAAVYSQIQPFLNNFSDSIRLGGSTETAYLKLDDVRGSATEATHKDQIPVLFSQHFVGRFGSGASSSSNVNATPSDYYLLIPIDQSGPILEQAAANGASFQQATISFLRVNRGAQTLHHIDTLTDVRVTFYMRTSAVSTVYPDVAIIGLSYSGATWAVGATRAGYNFYLRKNQ